jgi:endonuclease/exonuclease/phosphatase family metal-dependent hydrolase
MIDAVTDLVIMTWNLHGSAKPDIAGVAAAIAMFQPDVVGLQEVTSRQTRRLAHLLGYHHRWARKHFPYGPFLWWRAEGLAVLSPHSLDSRKRYILTPGVRSWTYRRRIAMRVKVRMSEFTLHVYDTHLASDDASSDRVDQAAILCGRIAAERQSTEVDGEPFEAIVVGDLNAHDEPETLAPFAAAGFDDAWTSRPDGADAGFTSPAHRPFKRLDFILHTPDQKVASIEVPPPELYWTTHSDHLPVIATLQFVDHGVRPPS